jgi:flavin-dependent dehydrogenase
VADLSPLLSAGAGRTDALLSVIGTAAPALGARLRDRVIGPVRGAAGLANQVRRPAGPGWALVGDAGYHRDPITGHGISDAFRDADLLAEAVHGWISGATSEQEAMQRYDGARTLAIREIFAITQELTTFPGVPRFTALQRRLSQAIDREALELAARPALSSEPVLAA